MLTTSDPTQAALSEPATCFGASCLPEEIAILGESGAMQRLRMQVRLLGPHFRIVLVRGEAGTGKELAARSLHAHSSHATGPFIRFECDRSEAAAERLVAGLKAAHRGTIYLPQIDAMRRDTQAALLATLQRHDRVLPRPIIVHGLEARIVASTTEDLRVAVSAGGFLHELYRRIGSVTIELPPMRERLEDIPVLARHFLENSALEDDIDLDGLLHSTLAQMMQHHWPGNVKGLKQIMQKAAEATFISGRDPQSMGATEPPHCNDAAATRTARLQDVMEQHVFQVLKECSGNKLRAAEVLGISRSTLYRMLEAGLQADGLR